VTRAGVIAAGALVTLVAACGRLGAPSVSLPGAGAGNEGTARLVENRVWLQDGAEPGAFRAFVADGTLVVGSCAAPARLGSWRWYDEGTLAWRDGDATVRADVAVVGPNTLTLMPAPVGDTPPLTFRPAQTPVSCPDQSS